MKDICIVLINMLRKELKSHGDVMWNYRKIKDAKEDLHKCEN